MKKFALQSHSAQQLYQFYYQFKLPNQVAAADLCHTIVGLAETTKLRPRYLTPCLLQIHPNRRDLVLAHWAQDAPGYIVIAKEFTQEIDKIAKFPHLIELQNQTPLVITAENLQATIPTPRQIRAYTHIVTQLIDNLDKQPIREYAQILPNEITKFGLQAYYESGDHLTNGHYGPLFDYWKHPTNLDLIAAVHRYDKLPIIDSILLVGKLCQHCQLQLREHYQLATIKIEYTDCRYCSSIDPEYAKQRDLTTVAVMDPKIFEKFIAYDSFFGNYMVKRYTDILEKSKIKELNPNKVAIPSIHDNDNYPEYFDQLLLQVMDHSNDIRVQKYFNDLRNLPMDKVATDQTVTSPYLRENKKSVYHDLKRGKKAHNDVDEIPAPVYSSAYLKTHPNWEPRTLRRRYTVNNFPIYPSENIHWVKRIYEDEKQRFQVLNFNPPETLGIEILTFLVSQSQGCQLFNNQVAGTYPTSQQSLDKVWKQNPVIGIEL